jgi:O-antigen ligase
VIVAFVAFVGIAQYLDILSMNRLTAAYGKITLLANGVEARRAVGTLGNPNYFGFTCAIGSCIAFATFLRRAPRLATFTSAGALALAIAGMLVSGSRGAVLSATTMVAILVGNGLVGQFSRTRALTATALAAVSAGLALGFLNSLPIVKRFSLFTGTANASSNSRASILTHRTSWDQALEVIRGHVMFGAGPSKPVLVQWVDNDMLRMTREFGIVGLACYVSLLLWLAWRLVTTNLTTPVGEKRWCASIGLALVGGLFVMGLTADVFYNERVMSMILVLAGLLCGWASTVSSTNSTELT